MKAFLNILNSIPAVVAAIQTVEAALPIAQTGQQKLNLILGLAEAAHDVAQAGEEISKGQLLAGVTEITNITVAALNAAGVFTHGARAAAPTTAPVSSK
jgi:hypothetical protein